MTPHAGAVAICPQESLQSVEIQSSNNIMALLRRGGATFVVCVLLSSVAGMAVASRL